MNQSRASSSRHRMKPTLLMAMLAIGCSSGSAPVVATPAQGESQQQRAELALRMEGLEDTACRLQHDSVTLELLEPIAGMWPMYEQSLTPCFDGNALRQVEVLLTTTESASGAYSL